MAVEASTMVEMGYGEPVILHDIFAISDKEKVRLIHNQSGRRGPGDINASINVEQWGGQVGSRHAHEAALEAAGPFVASVSIDVVKAYRTMWLCSEHQRYQSFYFEGKCYANLVLTFGNVAAGFIWNCLAAVLLWVIDDQLALVLDRSSYLAKKTGDDFKVLTCFAAHTTIIVRVLKEIFVKLDGPIGPKKNQCATVSLFAGVCTDLLSGTVFIKEARRQEFLADFLSLLERRKELISPKELHSFVGKVTYVGPQTNGLAGAYTQGTRKLMYAFPTRLHSVPCVTLTEDVIQDVKAVVAALRVMVPRCFRPTKMILGESDGSGRHGLGGCISETRTAVVDFVTCPFPPEFLLARSVLVELEPVVLEGQLASSALLELIAVVITAAVFVERLKGCTVLWTTDSLATVNAIQKSSSQLARSAQLLKCMAAMSIKYDISFFAVHRERRFMEHVDALTHYDIAKFKRLVPRAAASQTVVPFPLFAFLLNPTAVPSTEDIFSFF
jgi:hypothetical protein